MKFLIDKLRTKSFWVALIGALMLIIAHKCNFDAAAVGEIMEGIGGMLALLGIVAAPPTSSDTGESVPPDELPDGHDNGREE